jgi:nitrite reductase (cytochrome c-552)
MSVTLKRRIVKRPWIGWLLFLGTVAIIFVLAIFASSIMERRVEASIGFTQKVEYAADEPRNELWGENFPIQYQSYMKTGETSFKSKYNGNAMIDMLEVDPRLVVLWAGYGFSKDYNQGRGHVYAIEDIRNTLRTGGPTSTSKGPMPNTCWACKSPDVPRLIAEMGPADFYAGKWSEKGDQVVNAIGCADCHDAETMNLKITRPALVEAFERMGKNIEDASHQEMRSLVCAQCHVEYYFDKSDGKQNYLTFPWDNGFTAEDMEAYYDEIEFYDWVHPMSKAKMLKAQHPGWEVFSMGIHAERGVSCADCHMPYKSEGGSKFTDHHIQSPLNNVEASCAVCHRQETATLLKNVFDRQDKIIENRDKLEILIVKAHIEAQKAWELGATEKQMEAVLMDIRHAQWRWDYAAASHGGSFHAPLEISRVISTGIDIIQEGRIKLARILIELGFEDEVPYPDISTKAKAQEFIGLPMEELEEQKATFLLEVVPEWDEEAAKREAQYPVKKLVKIED